MRDEFGLIKLDETVSAAPLVIELTISNITPKTGLNPAGGNILTISGSNLPSSADERYSLSITINGNANCVPLTIEPWEITCEMEAFETARRRLQAATELDFVISFQSDGEEVSYLETGFELNPDPLKTLLLNPPKLSPIALTTLEI